MKKIKGFTLVEMIVTIMVVIILSTISVPIYKEKMNKAIYPEGYTLLAAIREAQLVYYHEYRNFLWGQDSSIGHFDWKSCNEDVLEINARTNKYFTAFAPGYAKRRESYKYSFTAYAVKPSVLWKTGTTYLALKYDLTAGTTFYEIAKIGTEE